ncbi:MAG: CPBP family intramembrane metalloprotease [Labilithrix sp.]|nr:CPBP family intramembrane metalloprotease [Labilithrix sp.]MCW5812298.1 CPBP family intramembrane metalloprotease [Labilithrix sp.]
MSQVGALLSLLLRHWSRASLPNRLKRSVGRRASAGLFRLAYVVLMSASGYGVGRTVASLATDEQRVRGAAWIVVGALGLAVVWSGMSRGPVLRGEPSPLETPLLDALPLRETARIAVGLVERLFVFTLAVSSFMGVVAAPRTVLLALLVAAAGVIGGEAGMRVTRVLVPPMTVARVRSYLLVGGQVVFLMALVQAPSLGRSPKSGVLVAGWPSALARALLEGEGLFVAAAGLALFVVAGVAAVAVAERIGYDRVDLVPTGRPRRTKREALVIDRIDEVLRRREPGGRWGTVLMAGYTAAVTTGVLAYAWTSKTPSFEPSSMVRLACGVAAFGSFVVVSARATRMAARDVAARPLLAPLPIEPRALLAGKVTRLRADAIFVCAPLLVLFATPWSVALHVEIAWRTIAVTIAAALAAKAAAAIAFLTVGAGSKKGPLGGFVVETVLVLVPLFGVASATEVWVVVVPLVALGFVAREAGRSALGCVRWIDDAGDFERETPIWRALLVLAAFQSTANIAERLVDMSELGPGIRLAIGTAASTGVLLVMTLTARSDAPLIVFSARSRAIALGLAGGALAGGVAILHRLLAARAGLALPIAPADGRVAAAALGVTLVPIAEELFFRGWLLSCIEAELDRKWLAPLLGAFAFAAVHPAPLFVPYLVLGLVTSVLFLRARAVLPCLAAHLVYAVLTLVRFG